MENYFRKPSVPRGRLGPLLLALVAVAAALWAQSLARKPEFLDPLILFAIAAALFLRALKRPDSDPPPIELVEILSSPSPDPNAPSASGSTPVLQPRSNADRPSYSPAAIGKNESRKLAVCLLIFGLVLDALALATFQRDQPLVTPWVLYFCGIGLALVGLWRLLGSGQSARANRNAVSNRTLLLLVIAILIGAFFRFYRLDEQPAGLFYDEAMWGLDANTVLSGEAYPVYFEANFGHGPLYIYLLALFIKLLGPTAFTLRLVSAIIGVLTIPALYVFVKPLFGPRSALVAAFLLAIARWHVNFSRIAFDAILLPLLVIVFFYLLLRALRSSRPRDFLLAGVAAALGLNSYVAFRLVPFIVLLFLLYELVRRRAFERRLVFGIGIMLFAGSLVASPLVEFYLQYPEVANQRLEVVNVFAGKTLTTAAQAVLDNTRLHLLMFNHAGDRNGRHNLPGEPMLDDITAALFVVGLCYALFRARRSGYAFFLIWFAVMLGGGIMSVDFEAPQALRAIGVLPVALVFSSIVLDRLLRLSTNRGVVVQHAMVGAIILLLGFGGYLNYNNYFVRQARDFASWHDFSTGEAFAAREMNALGSGWQFYVSSRFAGRPTVRFLAPDANSYRQLESTDYFPVRDSGDHNVAIFLDPQQANLFADARRYYPGATFKQIAPPFGGPPALLEVLLRREDVLSVQGLVARYYRGDTLAGGVALERQEQGVSSDWSSASSLQPPFAVEWSGTLNVPDYGVYLLGIRSPAWAEVWLDENLLLRGDGSSGDTQRQLSMAKGNHALRVRALVPTAAGRTELYWQPPNALSSVIPPSALYVPPVLQNGLLGSYYPNLDGSGNPALQQIDSSLALNFHNTVLPRPYSVEWLGKVEAPVAGDYRLGLEAIDDAWLEIDGRPVAETHQPNRYEEGRLVLSAGWHDIRVRYLDKSGWSHINLYWTPPGQSRQIIPAERLLPPRGDYPVAAKPAPVAPGAAAQPVQPPAFALSVDVAANLALKQPKDVAVSPDGSVYVADTGNGRVVHFDQNGRFLDEIGQPGNGPAQLEAPLGLALDPNGDLLVLDEASGYVNRFDADGGFRQRFGGPEAGFYHARGLAVGPDRTIYVADTGNARIVAYSPDGRKLRQLGGKGGEPGRLLGPVGLATDAEGTLWVADVDNNRIQRLSADGSPLLTFPMPPGESVDGAHLAVGQAALYLTDPVNHRVLIYNLAGQPLGQWGETAGGEGRLRRPVGVALGPDGSIWLADRDQNRVLRFNSP